MKDILVYSLGAFIAVMTATLIMFLIIYAPEKEQLINQSITTFLTNFTLMVGYYFGSSKGSADKNEIIKHENGKTG